MPPGGFELPAGLMIAGRSTERRRSGARRPREPRLERGFRERVSCIPNKEMGGFDFSRGLDAGFPGPGRALPPKGGGTLTHQGAGEMQREARRAQSSEAAVRSRVPAACADRARRSGSKPRVLPCSACTRVIRTPFRAGSGSKEHCPNGWLLLFIIRLGVGRAPPPAFRAPVYQASPLLREWANPEIPRRRDGRTPLCRPTGARREFDILRGDQDA